MSIGLNELKKLLIRLNSDQRDVLRGSKVDSPRSSEAEQVTDDSSNQLPKYNNNTLAK